MTLKRFFRTGHRGQIRRGRLASILLAVILITSCHSAVGAETDFDRVAEFINANCLDCHTGDDAERGYELTGFVAGFQKGEPSHAETVAWEKALLRIQSRQMPPPDDGQPEESDYTVVEDAMVRVLDRHAAEHPYAGETEPLRRMTRTEFRNAIRDLLSIEIDVAAILPPDSSSDGFDNITVGELSPLLIDRYLTAATRISRAVVGSGVTKPGGVTIRMPPDQSQENHVEGLPLGTRGGTLVKHHFPRDGEYEIQVRLTRDRDERVEGISEPHDLDVLVDRERRHRFPLKPLRGGQDHSTYDTDLNLRIRIVAGTHHIGVTFVEKSSALMEIKREPFDASYNRHRHPRRTPAIHEVSIVGPFGADADNVNADVSKSQTADDQSESRRALFIARPGAELSPHEAAETVFSKLMRRAYRRPVDQADLVVPMRYFEQAIGQSPESDVSQSRFESGIEAGLTSILVNPNFLFQAIAQPSGLKPGVPYRISPNELASRLSFFLWSSIPDEELLDAAQDGTLLAPETLEHQTRRMLTDSRSRSLVDSFADQWLYLRNLPTVTPDLRKFPDFDNNLREAFAEETKRLFADVIARDASVLELISSDHTFLNERLANHYEIPGVVGSHFRRVDVHPDWHRGGLLRHGSVLTATSYATRTSPTIRGSWVLENILGTPPPPPPPNVPTIKEKSNAAPLSFREALEKHRADATCASCHDLIDPVGFALDRYDAVGRWRSTVEGHPVDARGRLPDGKEVDGVAELEQGILNRPELFVMALTEKLMTYGLGRPVSYSDGPVVHRIVREAGGRGYRFSDLIAGITQSTPFLMRTSQ